ncbi:Dipeptide-binding ABC transporter, periplasmic substrate-binding component [Enhygromyxa salina]|uniref:Dipeptide-binding ABC transporter, periplasmic substrate-binding component n=1 Tax=Enhygromyxa salina TaxID=215803 RepID=A0A0C1ZRV8_9BACT|nr:Dipeptide-binding ABC transporter, periplasmic substrate-binding component [Enhygromyxa salina]
MACSTGQETLGSDTFSSLDGNNDESTGEDGPGDGDPGDGDGDPGDGDGDPGDGDGDPSGDGDGDGDGDTGDGDGDGDEVCARYLYRHNLANDVWETQPLDLVWTGPNAPPCSVEPKAAAYLEVWDQLLVWGGNGMYYRRIGGAWQPPEPIADRWAVVANLEIDSVTHVPPINGGTSTTVTFVSLPNALLYEVFEDGATNYDQTVVMTDEPPPGPSQSSSVRRWSAVLADPELLGQADWWVSYAGFDDGKIYRFDGAFVWSNWPANQAPVLAGAPPSLDPSKLEAGYGDHGLNRVYLIGP